MHEVLFLFLSPSCCSATLCCSSERKTGEESPSRGEEVKHGCPAVPEAGWCRAARQLLWAQTSSTVTGRAASAGLTAMCPCGKSTSAPGGPPVLLSQLDSSPSQIRPVTVVVICKPQECQTALLSCTGSCGGRPAGVGAGPAGR